MTIRTELLKIRTEDGIVLDGALFEGKEELAVVLFPAAAMNFYSGVNGFLPRMLAERGVTCLSLNHRGHDIASAPDAISPKVVGALHDCFQDCVIDVHAAVSLMQDRGYSKIILAGHSQSGLKILYAVKQIKTEVVLGLILISPPPSTFEMLRFLVGEEEYEKALLFAKQRALQGREEEILVLNGRGKLPYLFSCRTFLNLYSPWSGADVRSLAKDMDYPTLLVRGTKDLKPVSSDLMKLIKGSYRDPDKCRVVEIQGANHFFAGCEEQLTSSLLSWFEELRLT